MSTHGKELNFFLEPQNLIWYLLQLKPVTTCNTICTGVVLPQVQIFEPIPAPVIPASWIPQVNLYLCYTLRPRNEKGIPWSSSSSFLQEGSQSPPEICQSHRTFQTHSRWTSTSCLTTCATLYSVSESTTLNHLILRHLHGKMRNHTRLTTAPRATYTTTTPHPCFFTWSSAPASFSIYPMPVVQQCGTYHSNILNTQAHINRQKGSRSNLRTETVFLC